MADFKITLIDGTSAGGGQGGQGATSANPNQAAIQNQPLNQVLQQMQPQAAAGGGAQPVNLANMATGSAGAQMAQAIPTATPAAGAPMAQAIPTATSAATATAGSGAGIGEVVKGLALGVGILTAGAYAFKAGIDHFIARGEQLAQYSAPISAARAVANVRTTMSDIREAQELGGGIGRMTDVMSVLDEMMREILLPMKKAIVDLLADDISIIAGLVREQSVEFMIGLFKTLIDIVALDFDRARADIDKAATKIANAAKPIPPRPTQALMDNFNNSLGAGFMRGGPNDPMMTGARQALNQPGFGVL